MTNGEAIIHLDYLKDFKTPDQVEALNIAIEALKKEPCEDAISRQAVLDHIYGINGLEGLELSNVFEKHYADFIKSLPPVTPTPKDDVLDKIREEMEEKILPLNIDGIRVKSSCLGIIGKYKAKGVEE